MSRSKPVIAAIDDEKDILDTIKTVFKTVYSVHGFTDPEEAFRKISSDNIDLVLLDVKMPSCNGIDLLKRIKGTKPDTDVIMVTALSDSRTAVSAMKAGAYDYVSKPFDPDELRAVIERALEKRALKKENLVYKTISESSFGDILGTSPAMTDLFKMISKIASTDSTVLITGETGSGKELVAKAIHKKSGRARKPFVPVNCAAIPENLFETELFGHERGSFTGAHERHLGKFELSDGGTIFLDEIGCISHSAQAKLLRVLQENVITRIGGVEEIQIDTRFIFATNADLGGMVNKGTFREDLFYRMNVIPVNVPPLKNREGDVILLLEHFLGRFCRKMNKNNKSFSERAISALKKYRWPGNVRELENLVERSVVLSQNDIIDAGDLPVEIYSEHEKIDLPLNKAADEFEHGYIKKALLSAENNQTKAAHLLGIDRTTLISKIKKHLIDL